MTSTTTHPAMLSQHNAAPTHLLTLNRSGETVDLQLLSSVSASSPSASTVAGYAPPPPCLSTSLNQANNNINNSIHNPVTNNNHNNGNSKPKFLSTLDDGMENHQTVLPPLESHVETEVDRLGGSSFDLISSLIDAEGLGLDSMLVPASSEEQQQSEALAISTNDLMPLTKEEDPGGGSVLLLHRQQAIKVEQWPIEGGQVGDEARRLEGFRGIKPESVIIAATRECVYSQASAPFVQPNCYGNASTLLHQSMGQETAVCQHNLTSAWCATPPKDTCERSNSLLDRLPPLRTGSINSNNNTNSTVSPTSGGGPSPNPATVVKCPAWLQPILAGSSSSILPRSCSVLPPTMATTPPHLTSYVTSMSQPVMSSASYPLYPSTPLAGSPSPNTSLSSPSPLRYTCVHMPGVISPMLVSNTPNCSETGVGVSLGDANLVMPSSMQQPPPCYNHRTAQSSSMTFYNTTQSPTLMPIGHPRLGVGQEKSNSPINNNNRPSPPLSGTPCTGTTHHLSPVVQFYSQLKPGQPFINDPLSSPNHLIGVPRTPSSLASTSVGGTDMSTYHQPMYSMIASYRAPSSPDIKPMCPPTPCASPHVLMNGSTALITAHPSTLFPRCASQPSPSGPAPISPSLMHVPLVQSNLVRWPPTQSHAHQLHQMHHRPPSASDSPGVARATTALTVNNTYPLIHGFPGMRSSSPPRNITLQQHQSYSIPEPSLQQRQTTTTTTTTNRRKRGTTARNTPRSPAVLVVSAPSTCNSQRLPGAPMNEALYSPRSEITQPTGRRHSSPIVMEIKQSPTPLTPSPINAIETTCWTNRSEPVSPVVEQRLGSSLSTNTTMTTQLTTALPSLSATLQFANLPSMAQRAHLSQSEEQNSLYLPYTGCSAFRAASPLRASQPVSLGYAGYVSGENGEERRGGCLSRTAAVTTVLMNSSPSSSQQATCPLRVGTQVHQSSPGTRTCIASSPSSRFSCVICSDHAMQRHYGVIACEGCKSFFKRTIRREIVYICRDNQNCPMDRRLRNRCPYCRFQKCLRVGMRREAIREDRGLQNQSICTDSSGNSCSSPDHSGSRVATLDEASHTPNSHSEVTSTGLHLMNHRPLTQQQHTPLPVTPTGESMENESPTIVQPPPSSSLLPQDTASQSQWSSYNSGLLGQAESAILSPPQALDCIAAAEKAVEEQRHSWLMTGHKETSEQLGSAPGQDSRMCSSMKQWPLLDLLLWARYIPFFSQFPTDLQLTLLKSACLDLLLSQLVHRLTSPCHPSTEASASTLTDPDFGLFHLLSPDHQGNHCIDPTGVPPPPQQHSTPLIPLHPTNDEREDGESDRTVVGASRSSTADGVPPTLTTGSLEWLVHCAAAKLHSLRLRSTEIGSLKLIMLLNPDVPGLSSTERTSVEYARDQVYAGLEHQCAQLWPNAPHGRMGRLLLRIPALHLLTLRVRRLLLLSPSDCNGTANRLTTELVSLFYSSDPSTSTPMDVSPQLQQQQLHVPPDPHGFLSLISPTPLSMNMLNADRRVSSPATAAAATGKGAASAAALPSVLVTHQQEQSQVTTPIVKPQHYTDLG